ncbi:hypothetical protein [Streptomyces sp. NPDC093600]|uniref:hypothetical protein n=1 Tax=Streptomyces sp. NPDC093600 TaxID=3366047 RepID=UPI0038299627
MMKKLIRAVAGVAFIAAATVGALGAGEDPGWHSERANTQVAPADPGWHSEPALVTTALGDPGWHVAPAAVNDPGWSSVGA